MKFLPNEVELYKSKNKRIVLTNIRISMQESGAGKFHSIDIFLEDILSIENRYKNDFWLLVLAPIVAIGGFYIGDVEGLREIPFEDLFKVFGLTMGAILVVTWWSTRKRIVSICAGGGKSIVYTATGMGQEKINALVHQILIAKHERINKLNRIDATKI